MSDTGHTPLVRVKPLEWRTFENYWCYADTIVGGYEVRQGRASARVRFPQERQFKPFNGTIDGAKAAAQADFERRILSAIEPSPSLPILVEALEGLLDCPDIADSDYKDEETHAAERRARAALASIKGGQ